MKQQNKNIGGTTMSCVTANVQADRMQEPVSLNVCNPSRLIIGGTTLSRATNVPALFVASRYKPTTIRSVSLGTMSFMLFISFILFQSCGYPEEPKQVKFEDKFIIDYPSYLKECDDLTSEADLQYKNAYRNTYSIIRVEPKNGQTFHEFQQNAVKQIKHFDLIKDILVTDSAYRNTNNFNAIDIQMHGVMQEENIYYWNSCFETEIIL
ncbi:MAG: hypothetical protein LRY27_04290 [Chitinophagales bacterium]|nr:hypothetical protein [Chitinophagales bacterium]